MTWVSSKSVGEVLQQKHQKDLLWQILAGIGHMTSGVAVTGFGAIFAYRTFVEQTTVTVNDASGTWTDRPYILPMAGILIVAAGIGWASYGVYRLLTLPPPPQAPWAEKTAE